VFSGKTSETQTFETAIKQLSQRFKVTRSTLVCDRGMLSGKNLEFAENSGKMNYVIGEKLRKLPVKHQALVFTPEGYETQGDLKIKDLAHPTRLKARLIVVYSPTRAKKDKKDRSAF
jgi:transposase